ncbi:MAG: hypothetical protein GX040_05090 [Alcaligenaceae bacterium]|uniref:Uncharacterized protein n=1 Tax=uncultured bacterium IN-14 TaxID=1805592 RepID=A0A142BWJ0_9BACT|nr:hypothetical protein [uncultured bacterium IN-14]NLY34075.1 hypothetical protein [Alcaligenaceae bacterium]
MSKPLTSLFRSEFILVAALSLSQPLSAIASEANGDLKGAKLRELLDQSGIQCHDEKTFDCATGPYKVNIHSDCSVAPYYGAVYGQPTKLYTKADSVENDPNTLTSLAEDQLICIKATAKYGISDVAYFIMAMQDDRFENCNTADILCRVSAPLPEPYSTAMKHCKRLENGEITSCPQGWVKADAIEPYPNGLQ